MKVTVLKILRECLDWVRWNVPSFTTILSIADDSKLYKIVNELRQDNQATQTQQDSPVVFIPSYYQMKFSRMIDITIALALMARGVTIIPVLTGTFFDEEDVIFGGIYNNYRKSKKNWYSKLERLIWISLLKTKPVYIGDFVNKSDCMKAVQLTKHLTINNYKSLTIDGYDVGEKAAMATCNLNNVAELSSTALTPQLRAHARNCINLLFCYRRLFTKLKPTVIYSEFPHYYQWDVPFHVSQKMNIFFASTVTTEKKNSWFFATDMNSFQDATAAWKSFKDSQDCNNELKFVDEAISLRSSRKVSYSPVFPQQHSQALIEGLTDITSNKPTAFLPVNVLFDLAVFKKSPMFDSMLDMLNWTIDYFKQNPQFHLILKAHPAEKLFYESHLSNADNYCLGNWLKRNHSNLPKNITFLDYDSPISTFDIIPLIKLGLVYTSTTSIEMAWSGIPVVSTSFNHYNNKGFLINPNSKAELKLKIAHLLTKSESKEVIDNRILNSRKYYLLYYYHSFINFGLTHGSDTGKVKDTITYSSIHDLMEGQNEALDYVCSSILERKTGLGKDRWPPFTNTQ